MPAVVFSLAFQRISKSCGSLSSKMREFMSSKRERVMASLLLRCAGVLDPTYFFIFF
jgi:hypothetical protein